MKRSAKRHSEVGFTLIETLVVIGIMTVLSAMLIAYNHSNTAEIALTTDQATVAGALNRAKAMTLEKYAPSTSAGNVACAYGVHFVGGKSPDYVIYGIFANSVSDCGQTSLSWSGQANQLAIGGWAKLDSGLVFSLPNDNSDDIYFLPPYIEASSTNGFTVTLEVLASGQTATVDVSPTGAVSF
ncbi:type II secretion system GspH family protein [Patescibacteria group bacterium]|nr:type II secretion system GspH family protein [Patescibacteria group bacterium]